MNLNSGNRYRIMVMVPGKRKLDLTLAVKLQLQHFNLLKGEAQGSKHLITRSEMGAGQFQNWVTM